MNIGAHGLLLEFRYLDPTFFRVSLTDGDLQPEKLMMNAERIEAILDRIRPFLRADGGDVELVDVGDSIVKVRFTGLCTQCGSAPLSMHMGLSEVLREEIPGFCELILL